MLSASNVFAAADDNEGKLSLIEVAPSLYYTAKRSWKFYGDKNTTQGSISERSHLLGNINGARDKLVDHGVYIDAGVTQFLQGNLSGGDRDSPDPRTNGSTDVWLWLDTGKADLWSGGALFAHWEANWGTSMNADVGSLLPANSDATMPRANNPPSAKLSELYYMQALPGHLVAAFGKQNMAAWADTSLFANNERTQFTYVGMVNNAIAGVFFPYTVTGAWLDWAPNKAHNLVGVWSQGDEAKAGNVLRGAAEEVPESADIQHVLGLSLVRRQQRTQEAIRELKRAATRNPQSARYVYVYAVSLNSTGKADEAIQILQGAHTAHPNNRDILAALVAFHSDSGNEAAAQRYAQKLRAISP